MALAGAPVLTSVARNTDEIRGGTLAARAGGFAVAAADSGELTTAAIGANQTALTANLGPGRGLWTQALVDAVSVELHDLRDAAEVAAADSIVHLVDKVLVAANLVVRIHNRGAVATGNLLIRINFQHSLVR